jgi:pSer/pThr/pTyr-binding forkhead associated (FHA) protein
VDIRAAMATLIVTWPEDGRQTFPLEGDRVTVGRGPENAIRIESPYLSVLQAEFRRLPGGGGYGLVDLGSANGTFVNGLPAREDEALREGDRIRFGPVAAEVQGLPEASPLPATPVPGALAASGGADADERLAEANREIERLRRQLEAKRHAKEAARQVEASRRETDQLRDEQARLQESLGASRLELEALRDEAAALRGRIQGDREEAERLRQEVAAARRERDEAVERFTREQDGADEERSRLAASFEQTRQELAAARDLLRKTELRCQEAERGLGRMRTEERVLTDRLQMLHRQQFAAEKRLRELAGEEVAESGPA